MASNLEEVNAQMYRENLRMKQHNDKLRRRAELLNQENDALRIEIKKKIAAIAAASRGNLVDNDSVPSTSSSSCCSCSCSKASKPNKKARK
ncbi:hypothetical protein ACJIZ3_024392 [Penstemon smallii]|uniref:Uncharacterized protein n=1 Tax=Penstemon smallii TaxID=265156 RepID=A0ABD3TT15_9LAMI